MIEMNKKKNEEIRGFLKWLEREIGAEIDNLTNKTAIKEYHEHTFNQLLEVYRKNRTKGLTILHARNIMTLILVNLNGGLL